MRGTLTVLKAVNVPLTDFASGALVARVTAGAAEAVPMSVKATLRETKSLKVAFTDYG